MGENGDRITARLVALRGDRKQREIARKIGVTPQAVSQWESTGRVSREYVEDYDAALGAEGEVMALLGFTRPGGPTLADVDRKLDDLLALVRGMGAALRRLADDELGPELPAPATSPRGRREPMPSVDPTGPLPRP